MAEWPIRMRRSAAAKYLSEMHGITMGQATLAKNACIGAPAPRFRLDGRYPVYDREELDRWAVERLGPLRTTTKEARHG